MNRAGGQTSIKKKLILYVLLLIVMAVVFTLGPTLYLFTEYTNQEAKENVVKGMEGFQLILEETKEQATNYATLFADHPGVAKAIEEKNTDEILAYLVPLAKEAKINFVTVTDEQGNVIARTHEPSKKGDSVKNQTNVVKALQGTTFAAIEPGTVVKLSARAGVPVKNAAGKIVGVVSAGYVVGNDAIVDKAKAMFATDFTLFLGDTRIASTIMKDGQRIIGTKLNEKIADLVLKQEQKYTGRTDILGKDFVVAYMPLLGPDNKPIGVIFSGKNSEVVDVARNKIIATVGVISLVMLILVIGATRYIVEKMVSPLNELAKVVSQVTNGDLTQVVKVTTNDEIGTLAIGFNKMIAQLKTVVIQLSRLGNEVAGAAETLKGSSQISSMAADQVTSAIQEVANGVEKQSIAIQQTTSVIEEMIAGIADVATNATTSATMSNAMSVASKDGGKAVERAVTQMHSIETAVSHSAQVVEKLGERSGEIGEIVVAIAGIASQTNLLALNAAIEAARAGEQGKGFAVVAEEVRKLAEQSQESTEKIGNLISGIQEDTKKAVIAMTEGKEEVKVGTEVVVTAGAAFKKITAMIEDVSMQVAKISSVAREMDAGSQHIITSVQDIEKVSTITAGQVENVSGATEEQSASTEEMTTATHSMLVIAQELQQVVNQFKV